MFSSVTAPTRAVLSARPRTVVAAAAAKPVERRDVLALLAGVPVLAVTGTAQALIPDDDDEQLVEKAKAGRKAKLAQDQKITREFVSGEGIRDRSIEASIAPIQNAVYKLAKCGEELEGGNAAAAAATLGASWVGDFAAAVSTLSTTESSKLYVPQMMTSIKSAGSAATAGDVVGAKAAFVSAVQAIEAWTLDAGVAGQLKGL